MQLNCGCDRTLGCVHILATDPCFAGAANAMHTSYPILGASVSGCGRHQQGVQAHTVTHMMCSGTHENTVRGSLKGFGLLRMGGREGSAAPTGVLMCA